MSELRRTLAGSDSVAGPEGIQIHGVILRLALCAEPGGHGLRVSIRSVQDRQEDTEI